MMKRILFIFLLPALVFANSEDTSAQLQNITEEIDALRTTLEKDENEQERLQEILKELDLQIAQSSKKLNQTDAKLTVSQKKLAELTAQYTKQTQQLQIQQGAMQDQIRSTFLLGQHDGLKLLLNQNDPHTLGRLMVYFDYFNHARAKAMQELQIHLTELATTQAAQQEAQTQLHVLQQEQQQMHTDLAAQKKAQSALVAQLLTDIEEKNSALATLEADQKALSAVMARLAQTTGTFMGSTDKPLRDYHGKLPWPVQGKVVHQFGDPYLAENTWQGMFIAAPEGTVVRAIYKGQVVYADWLRGLGLITIVNHGDDYMSLYAHNQSLYKNVGDTVDVDEPIAQVGKSGSVANPGLYFEIRQKGEVQNPMPWLIPKASSS